MELQLNNLWKILSLVLLILPACSKVEDWGEDSDQRFRQSMVWNSTHPYRELNVPTDNYSIMAMGDSHVGKTANLDTFFKNAKSSKAIAVVMAGDLTTGQESDYNIFDQHLAIQDSLVSLPIAGNHDLFNGGWQSFYSKFGASSYLFSVKTPDASDLFICLETGGGTLGEKQLRWLTDVLEKDRPQYRHCIIFTHNNFFRTRHTDSTNPEVEEVEFLLDLFTRYRVELVITAHDHKRDSEVFGGTTYITMDALKDGLGNAGYFQIRITNGAVGFEFKNI
jgi:3',5'-cyclic AMP phosphodiesterase CpdA